MQVSEGTGRGTWKGVVQFYPAGVDEDTSKTCMLTCCLHVYFSQYIAVRGNCTVGCIVLWCVAAGGLSRQINNLINYVLCIDSITSIS